MAKRIIVATCLAWAFLGFAIAMVALPEVNADAKLLVGSMSVLLPAAAVGAAWAANRSKVWLTVVLLLISVGTPTYMLYVANLIPVILAAVLARRGRVLLDSVQSNSVTV